jgi:hypothetical protein
VAFPTIPTAAAGRVLTNTQADTTATRTFPSLSSLTKNSGDLLIAIAVAYQSNTGGSNNAFSGWTGSFTEFGDFSADNTNAVGCAYKWSTGSETGTIAVTQAATITGHAGMILLAIPGAHASTAPEAGGNATGSASAADSTTLDPSGWATEDTLWITVASVGETSTVGSWQGIGAGPDGGWGNMAQTGQSADATGAVDGGVSFLQSRASSVDPAVWTSDTSNARWRAITIAVRPAPVTIDAQPGSFAATGSEAGFEVVVPRPVVVMARTRT